MYKYAKRKKNFAPDVQNWSLNYHLTVSVCEGRVMLYLFEELKGKLSEGADPERLSACPPLQPAGIAALAPSIGRASVTYLCMYSVPVQLSSSTTPPYCIFLSLVRGLAYSVASPHAP